MKDKQDQITNFKCLHDIYILKNQQQQQQRNLFYFFVLN